MGVAHCACYSCTSAICRRHANAIACGRTPAHEAISYGQIAALRALLDEAREASRSLVLATGGGVVEYEENLELLRERTTCVWLNADVEVLRARMRADATPRPALTGDDPVAEIERIADRRNPLYCSVAHFTFDASSDDIDGVAQSVTKRCLSR